MHCDSVKNLNLKYLQFNGYAEVYACNDHLFKDNPFIFDPLYAEEMEAAFESGINAGEGVVRMRGFLQQVHFASSELHYKAEVFRPDPSGDEFFVQPVSEDGKFIDLVWATIDLDAWGFSTGRGAVLGSENLSKIYTAELPLHVYDDPILYWEHLGDEELAGQDAICLLKPTARALIPAVGHVQVFYWDGVEGLAEGFFPDHPERVSAWQDREAFDSFVNRAALWERFDHMESPIPPETSRLTWAHAKAAIKSRRKVNNQTELDGIRGISRWSLDAGLGQRGRGPPSAHGARTPQKRAVHWRRRRACRFS